MERLPGPQPWSTRRGLLHTGAPYDWITRSVVCSVWLEGNNHRHIRAPDSARRPSNPRHEARGPTARTSGRLTEPAVRRFRGMAQADQPSGHPAPRPHLPSAISSARLGQNNNRHIRVPDEIGHLPFPLDGSGRTTVGSFGPRTAPAACRFPGRSPAEQRPAPRGHEHQRLRCSTWNAPADQKWTHSRPGGMVAATVTAYVGCHVPWERSLTDP